MTKGLVHGPIGMHTVETSPGHINLVCDVSGRPHSRTNEYGMFCDSPDCECEKRSMEMMPHLSNFINVAAGMLERNEPLDEAKLYEAMFGKIK